MNRDALSRLVVFALAVAGLLVFSEMTLQSLAVLSLGGVVMLLGMAVYYRPGAVVGMLMMAASAACCMKITTLTEVRMIFSVLLGLLLPSALLIWLALSAESGQGFRLPRLSRPFVIGASYLLICVISAPIVAAVIGIISPTVATRVEGLTEVSIVLLVAATGAAVLVSRDVKHIRMSVREEPGEAVE